MLVVSDGCLCRKGKGGSYPWKLKWMGLDCISVALCIKVFRKALSWKPLRPRDIRALLKVQMLQAGKYSSSWGSNIKPVCANVYECPKPHRHTHNVLVSLESDSGFFPVPLLLDGAFKLTNHHLFFPWHNGWVRGCTCSCIHSGGES